MNCSRVSNISSMFNKTNLSSNVNAIFNMQSSMFYTLNQCSKFNGQSSKFNKQYLNTIGKLYSPYIVFDETHGKVQIIILDVAGALSGHQSSIF